MFLSGIFVRHKFSSFAKSFITRLQKQQKGKRKKAGAKPAFAVNSISFFKGDHQSSSGERCSHMRIHFLTVTALTALNALFLPKAFTATTFT